MTGLVSLADKVASITAFEMIVDKFPRKGCASRMRLTNLEIRAWIRRRIAPYRARLSGIYHLEELQNIANSFHHSKDIIQFSRGKQERMSNGGKQSIKNLKIFIRPAFALLYVHLYVTFQTARQIRQNTIVKRHYIWWIGQMFLFDFSLRWL